MHSFSIHSRLVCLTIPFLSRPVALIKQCHSQEADKMASMSSGSKRLKSDIHFLLNQSSEPTARSGAAFSSSAGRNQNAGEQPSAIKCDQCSATFRSRTNLQKHIRSVHEKKKGYVCDRCGKGFSFKDGLTRHVSTVHDNERKFPCPLCPPRFKQNAHLQTHVRSMRRDQN